MIDGRNIIIAAILALSASFLFVGQANALSADGGGESDGVGLFADTVSGQCSNNVIASGLWMGLNLTMGGQYKTCQKSTTSSPSVQQTDDVWYSDEPAEVIDDTDTTEAREDSVKENGEANDRTGRYVALGDSVAAGAGLKRANGGDPACDVSAQAYPAVVAAALQRPYQNYACSGATVGDLVTEQHLSGTSRDIEPQLDSAFSRGVPSLITITAGANDTNWSYFIRKCYTTTCGTDTDRTVAATVLTTYRVKLEYALSEISRRSNGRPPEVILTGYYIPFSKKCADTQEMVTETELRWLNQQTSRLNRTISGAAGEYSYVSYAPVNFNGHELCTESPWIQGVTGGAPFHPTAQGQKEIAESVLRRIN